MLLVFQTISYEAPPFSDDEKVDDFDDFWPLTIFRQRLAWHSLWHFILLTDQVAASASSPIVFYSPSCRFFGRFGAASLQQLAWHSPWHDCHGWRDIRPFVVSLSRISRLLFGRPEQEAVQDQSHAWCGLTRKLCTGWSRLRYCRDLGNFLFTDQVADSAPLLLCSTESGAWLHAD